MSKERELLERWLDDTILEPEEFDSLIEETKQLLAQPSQDCPEYEDGQEFDGWEKRSGLTGQEISQGFRVDKDAINAESYWAGVALAEKHHKIGGRE
tara:strand:+ start:39 stop:329 length:291 start_codon:yes stop_codon:yes gene_type:complete